jgi:hypothetical protein
MLSRALSTSEATRRCQCGHVLIASPGDLCPRCKAVFPDVAAVHDSLVTIGRLHGPGELARIAPVLGVVGRLVTNGERVFGVIDA